MVQCTDGNIKTKLKEKKRETERKINKNPKRSTKKEK